MALDKVIDSAVLDASLTSVADAIRAKGGTSEQLAFPDGFVSAVDEIKAGGIPEWFAYVEQFNEMFSLLSWKSELPVTELDLDMRTYFPACKSMQSCLVGRFGVEKVTVHTDALTTTSNMFFNHGTFNEHDLKEIDISDCVTKNITDWTSFCAGRKGLHTIKGIIDFSSATNINQMFRYCAALTNVEFVPNTLGIGTDAYAFADCSSLSDATIISFANAMKAGEFTLTIHATPKARCNEILGVVSTITDDDGEYQFFTQDDAGTVTLTEFITTTKGWTLA